MSVAPGQAYLSIYWHKGPPAYVPCQYNPTELQIEKAVQYAEIGIPGLAAPLQQFVRGQAKTLTAELFFDTSDHGTGREVKPVVELTDPIVAATCIDPDAHAPPIIHFVWGGGFPSSHLPDPVAQQAKFSFRGVLTNVRQNFTFFSRFGVPLRAKLNITLKEYWSLSAQLLQLRLASADRTHAHVLKTGETLSALAGDQYGDASDWRRIAELNRIDDPRRLAPGARLALPAMTAGAEP
jgi:hypothetical protein